MLFAYVVCSLLVAEVYSYDPFLFGDDTKSGGVHHPRRPNLPVQPTPNPGPVTPQKNPDPVYPPNNPGEKHQKPHGEKHQKPHGDKHQKPHESRDAEAQQKIREIYEEVAKAQDDVVNDPRKKYHLVGNVMDAAYGDDEAERKVQDFLKGNQIAEGRYNEVRQEVFKLLIEQYKAENSGKADKVTQLQYQINQNVYELYNQVVYSPFRRLKFIKLILDGAAEDLAALNRLSNHYDQYPEDFTKLDNAVIEARKDIDEVRNLYNVDLSARAVAEEVKGYALDVELVRY